MADTAFQPDAFQGEGATDIAFQMDSEPPPSGDVGPEPLGVAPKQTFDLLGSTLGGGALH